MSVILDIEGRGVIAEIFEDLKQTPQVEEPAPDEWLPSLIAWIVDEAEHYKSNDAAFSDKLQFTWAVGNRLESELCGRFKKIVATPNAVFPFIDADGLLQAGVVDTVKIHPMNDDPREIACALAAEMIKADSTHDTLFINVIVRKLALYSAPVQYRYETRFATAKTT